MVSHSGNRPYLVDASVSDQYDESSVVLLDAIVYKSLNPFVDLLLHFLSSIIIIA
jgi:hypothetical protein